ncbi:MAG: patatin-like phospholipase family protein [Rhodopseudomonas palustris]|nr:patatin-like phospholipase family protein [Rhodopseudomonas palustris]
MRIGSEDAAHTDEYLIGLSFSGGGTRAAAFSFGVLNEMDRVPLRGASASMLDRIDFISGVSGGSVTAAYFSLKNALRLPISASAFCCAMPRRAADARCRSAPSPRAFSGGINDATGFTNWLDAHLFEGATFRAVPDHRPAAGLDQRLRHLQPRAVRVRPDRVLGNLQRSQRLSVVECGGGLGGGADRVRADGGASVPGQLQRSAAGLDPARGQRPQCLADAQRLCQGDHPLPRRGGAVHQAARRRPGRQLRHLRLHHRPRNPPETPYGPLSPTQAVKLRRVMFLVVDAKIGISGNWVNTIEGPSGVELIKAAVDTTMDASVGASYTAFDRTMT